MAASKEWKEWHLTPAGWIGGSEKSDFQPAINVEPPKDRVLSCVYEETLPSAYSNLRTSIDLIWSSNDIDLIKKLTNEFGDCPGHL